jgi:pyruvate-formate lyase
VQSAWDDPTDWDDLSVYGFYCLEAAVEAAAVRVGMKTSKKHWEKADVAGELHMKHGLPDIEQLLRDLNDARKSAAYGDIPAPDLNAEDVASEIERYVDAVADLVERTADNGA